MKLRFRSVLDELIVAASRLLMRDTIRCVKQYARAGAVLDIGGADFFKLVYRDLFRQGAVDSWTVLEPTDSRIPDIERYDGVESVRADGCDMPEMESGGYDTVINIQVLEHVFEPLKMVGEISRVLKPGGHAIIVLPQTAAIHAVPDIYGNFTKYWAEKAFAGNGLAIVEMKEYGGSFMTLAYRMVNIVLAAARVKGFSDPDIKRPRLFWAFFPFMLLFIALAMPVCLLFSLVDLKEEPTNRLFVVRKK